MGSPEDKQTFAHVAASVRKGSKQTLYLVEGFPSRGSDCLGKLSPTFLMTRYRISTSVSDMTQTYAAIWFYFYPGRQADGGVLACR